MEPRKLLLFGTLGFVLSFFVFAVLVQGVAKISPEDLHAQQFPSFGRKSAPVEVVLIEDFQCKNCREFGKKVLPKLQSHYIRGGKIHFTLVPVSFLSGSQAISNALLEIYHQNPGQLFRYIEDILQYESEVKESDLLRLARRLQGIDLEKLRSCIRNRCHDRELKNNLSWAQNVMGSRFKTPALYVNGAVGSTYSIEAIEDQINSILEGL